MYNSGIFYQDERRNILLEELDKQTREDWMNNLDKKELVEIIDDLCMTLSLYQEDERNEYEYDLEIEDLYDDKPNM